ncbi:thiamine pyrophosphate-dependent enzyme [Mucisphaera calidilacus]|uniref:Acetoin:2,6-dichlorophenolindophenol oxidoreductase subunit alpha n=1 Tax=Mucisphaera calidilacus TaxID=2527982 RepID=A0A518C0Z2_9BACT|nr:thiamine pyrophosphate-dependent enzyme [Mucisphaera calidilacus]QDU72889.1 Acetoin:2,6-dichlorophenolindophenol oxidoreductase subunit alpha [Mucisphaera calidilacus]
MTMATEDATVVESRPSDALSAEELLDMLWMLRLIRRFEERTMQSYMQQKIGGFCHIYIGQEAVATGICAAIRHEDPIVGPYRDHGHALAKGMDPNYCMAEMFGKITGCAKGKGGSMHMFDRPNHMYGGHAIVGGQCPLGAGLGFALQYEEKDGLAVCFLGDGALNQGAFMEAMNLASIWNLPVMFVLENNQYSMGTHIARGTSMAEDLAAKAEAFGMRYAECDGHDVLDVYDVFAREAARTRGAKNPQWERGAIPTYSREGRDPGPVFVNAKTYRYQGHSMSDPQKYRSKDEVAEVQQRDCIESLERHLLDRGMADQARFDEIDARAKQVATDSVKFAEASEPLSADELYTDVYVNTFGPYRRGETVQILRDAENKD